MSDTMVGAVLHGAKDLRVERRPLPELHHGEVLIRVKRAGICGSDLHYFEHGYCAAFVPTRPFVLGHELVGEVATRAEAVDWPETGTRVVVNPARPCGSCGHCRAGRQNLCARTVMLGSASTRPPTDGAFAHFVVVRADQCHRVPAEMDDDSAAMIEPLAVALHAIKRAGTVGGKGVLVLGGGPIGLLVAMSARAFGGLPVVVCDPLAARRHKALAIGAEGALDPTSPTLTEAAKKLTSDGFDVVFEASGAPVALRQAFELVRTGGVIVQIGTLWTQDVPLPANELMVREIQLLGSFRYGNVFDEAVHLAASGRVNLRPLVSQVLGLNEISHAMNLALSKGDVLKIQIQI